RTRGADGTAPAPAGSVFSGQAEEIRKRDRLGGHNRLPPESLARAAARAIRQPQAFRAVGQANRANPLPIVVPCHRVLGADGSLTGYSGTRRLDLKAQLLAIEHGAGSR